MPPREGDTSSIELYLLLSVPPSRAGNIYGIPWRSSSILEFDPETKAIRLFGKITATNYTWRVEAID